MKMILNVGDRLHFCGEWQKIVDFDGQMVVVCNSRGLEHFVPRSYAISLNYMKVIDGGLTKPKRSPRPNSKPPTPPKAS